MVSRAAFSLTQNMNIDNSSPSPTQPRPVCFVRSLAGRRPLPRLTLAHLTHSLNKQPHICASLRHGHSLSYINPHLLKVRLALLPHIAKQPTPPARVNRHPHSPSLSCQCALPHHSVALISLLSFSSTRAYPRAYTRAYFARTRAQSRHPCRRLASDNFSLSFARPRLRHIVVSWAPVV